MQNLNIILKLEAKENFPTRLLGRLHEKITASP